MTPPRKRLDEDGFLCRFAQRIAQTLDRGIQTMIKVDERVRRPKFAAQFVSRNDVPRSFKQRDQHLKGLFLESYLLSPLAQFPCLQIQFERTEPDNAGHRIGGQGDTSVRGSLAPFGLVPDMRPLMRGSEIW
jgi:hypothetical protein